MNKETLDGPPFRLVEVLKDFKYFGMFGTTHVKTGDILIIEGLSYGSELPGNLNVADWISPLQAIEAIITLKARPIIAVDIYGTLMLKNWLLE